MSDDVAGTNEVSWLRYALFIVLLAAFFVWATIAIPTPAVNRAAGYCAIVYIGGAWLLCFGDFEYGLFPPKSLRPLFVIGGIALMAIAIALVHLLEQSAS